MPWLLASITFFENSETHYSRQCLKEVKTKKMIASVPINPKIAKFKKVNHGFLCDRAWSNKTLLTTCPIYFWLHDVKKIGSCAPMTWSFWAKYHKNAFFGVKVDLLIDKDRSNKTIFKSNSKHSYLNYGGKR